MSFRFNPSACSSFAAVTSSIGSSAPLSSPPAKSPSSSSLPSSTSFGTAADVSAISTSDGDCAALTALTTAAAAVTAAAIWGCCEAVAAGGMVAGSISSSSSSDADSTISSTSSSYCFSSGGGRFGTRSKSIAVRHSFTGGRRRPNTSGTCGRGCALVCVAKERMYYDWRRPRGQDDRACGFVYFILTAAKRERVTHLFWDATTELPAYAGLHGERDVVHLGLVRAAGVLCVYECVREDLCGVPVREFEKLVQDAR